MEPVAHEPVADEPVGITLPLKTSTKPWMLCTDVERDAAFAWIQARIAAVPAQAPEPGVQAR